MGKYNINENFFGKWSIPMAWVFGYFCADGCVYQNLLTIQITSKDKELLEKVNSAMESNYPIKIKKNGKFLINRLQLTRKSLCLGLVKLGMNPNKSKNFRLPNIPKKFLGHFLRGYIDGDGTVYSSKTSGSVSTRIYTGSLLFAKDLQKKLNNLGYPTYIYDHHPGQTWQIHVNIKTFLPWIYHQKGKFYLKRKYQSYLKGLKDKKIDKMII